MKTKKQRLQVKNVEAYCLLKRINVCFPFTYINIL